MAKIVQRIRGLKEKLREYETPIVKRVNHTENQGSSLTDKIDNKYQQTQLNFNQLDNRNKFDNRIPTQSQDKNLRGA